MEAASAGLRTSTRLEMFITPLMKGLGVTKGSFTEVDHRLRHISLFTVFFFFFFPPINGRFSAFVGWPLERDGFFE